MQDKQKVTLYIPPSLHRKLKVKAALETESMSALVERAVSFYLDHPETVDELEHSPYGKTHQVHSCPDCDSALVIREGRLVSLGHQPSVLDEESRLGVEVPMAPERSLSPQLPV